MSGLFGPSGAVDVGYQPDYSDCVLAYCQWFQSDFLGGVRGMTAAEIGVYTMLLNEMYERGRPLSQPDAALARLCGIPVPGFRRALSGLIAGGKIIKLECGLWNVRVEKAFMTRKIQRDANSWAGVQSGKKRNENKDREATLAERPLNARATKNEPYSESHKEKSSVDKSTGAEAPIDPVKIMFDSGRALLLASGKTADAAGKLLGKWRGDHGAEAVIAALGKAQREGATDPVAFIEGCLKHKAKRDSLPQVGDRKTNPDGQAIEYEGENRGWVKVWE